MKQKRKFTDEHREKLRQRKLEYYSKQKGKRPYNINCKSNYTKDELKIRSKLMIELFNDIYRNYGEITEQQLKQYEI